MIGATLALGVRWFPLDRLAVLHWRARLASAAAAEAACIVQRIAALGEAGLETLAAQLESPRTSVVEAVRRSIREKKWNVGLS